MGTEAERASGVVTGSVADSAATFRFGIEEEYFLVDAETKAIAPTVPQALFAAARSATGGRGKCELLQQQLEVATAPHVSMAKARAELGRLRRMLAAVAAPHGLAILAAGTHPSAAWTEARQTRAERYDTVMHDLQMIGRRNMLCGLHVHVELPDPDARVDVMTRMLPYLPIFIALATSSPFWQSRRTGLLGYRLAAYDELPRTGVPELFRTREEFEAYVDTLVRARVMPEVGGDTMFSDMVAAYEGLSPAMKEWLCTLTAVHDGGIFGTIKGGTEDSFRELYPPQEHPIVRTHPETGERALYVNSAFTTHVVGLSKKESDWLLDHHGVAVVPGSAFGDERCFRLSFAASDEALAEGLRRIAGAIATLDRSTGRARNASP